MSTRSIELARIELPDFGLPGSEPEISAALYEQRIRRARERAAAATLDALVVYADREHFANMTYLTGYDPRFEEALLVLVPERRPTLLVGNEGMAYSAVSPVDLDRVLCQTFSLPGQPRSTSKPLRDLLGDAGLGAGQTVGVAGWKYFEPVEAPEPDLWIDAPSFITDTIRAIVREVRNANRLFMSPVDGMRAINEVEQLARFEFATTYSSQFVRNLIFGARPGMSELEAMPLAGLNGIPLSDHPILVAGPRTAMFIPSPSSYTLRVGDPIFAAIGVWGGNTARAGFLVAAAAGLPPEAPDYVERLVTPYFAAIVEWYETIGIGVTGGELWSIVNRRLGDAFFGVGLNPGHLLHLDEWVSSPMYEGSADQLRSGMMIQVDVIPLTHSAYHMSNIEDGIALADDAMRAEMEARYPEAWSRIQARRAFMRDALGIQLKPEVLPLSNIPAYLPPYWLAPQLAMRVAECGAAVSVASQPATRR
ncbi:MAG TPA: aminopeptidase P family N-terminal domain-containing protein [Thermomicrobiales bacterium]|nr:aminopeptidase P family N-terminal domain-containing protein [Thermomicrobiales bacterium]